MRNLSHLFVLVVPWTVGAGLAAPVAAQSPYQMRPLCSPAASPPAYAPLSPPPVWQPIPPGVPERRPDVTAAPPAEPPSAPQEEPRPVETPPPAPPAPAPAAPPAFVGPLPDMAGMMAAAEPGPGSDMAVPQGESLALFNSSVGYIDPAIPWTMARLRFDAAYDSNRPNRAEFIYARGAPFGPGVPVPERRIDYQILSPYFEYAFRPTFSMFLEVPVHFINPDVNANASGLGDVMTGFKYAFVRTPTTVSTFQLKAYAPSGNARLGLGTNHATLEPGLLFFRQLSPRLRGEAELRYWIPVGGTDFAGDIVRYGVGVSYGARPVDAFWLTPVTELVGWTVLSGKESFPTATGVVVEGASGDTIVNAKIGVRAGYGNRGDIYAGYGRPITGEVWYKNLWRVEMRLFF